MTWPCSCCLHAVTTAEWYHSQPSLSCTRTHRPETLFAARTIYCNSHNGSKLFDHQTTTETITPYAILLCQEKRNCCVCFRACITGNTVLFDFLLVKFKPILWIFGLYWKFLDNWRKTHLVHPLQLQIEISCTKLLGGYNEDKKSIILVRALNLWQIFC